MEKQVSEGTRNMRKENFEIVLERNEEQWPGRLTLQVDENGVSGCIVIGAQQSFFRGKTLRKDRYIVSLHLQIEVWLLVTKDDGSLTGVLISPWQSWKLSGMRQNAAFARREI